jgi:hypothetical protein
MPSKSSKKDASPSRDKKSTKRSKNGRRKSRRQLDTDDPRSDEDSKKPGDGFSSSDADKTQAEQPEHQQQQQPQPTSAPPPMATAGPADFAQAGHGFFKDGEPESDDDDDEPDVAIAVDDDDLDEVEPLLMFEEQFIMTDSDSDSSSESSGARSDDGNNNQGGEAKALSAGGYRLAKNAQTFVEEEFRSGAFIEVKASSAAEAAAAATAGTTLDGVGGKVLANALALRCEITLTCAGFKVMSMSIVMGLLVRSHIRVGGRAWTVCRLERGRRGDGCCARGRKRLGGNCLAATTSSHLLSVGHCILHLRPTLLALLLVWPGRCRVASVRAVRVPRVGRSVSARHSKSRVSSSRAQLAEAPHSERRVSPACYDGLSFGCASNIATGTHFPRQPC